MAEDLLTDWQKMSATMENGCGRKPRKRIGHLYPKVKTATGTRSAVKRQLSAWIWARTVKCPNPSLWCEGCRSLPLFGLSKKRGKKAWIEPIVDRAKKISAV